MVVGLFWVSSLSLDLLWDEIMLSILGIQLYVFVGYYVFQSISTEYFTHRWLMGKHSLIVRKNMYPMFVATLVL